ncbi:N,N-dimethylformamidase [Arthrobacter sp. cf158]|uniref:N,N-dimethylformamidase beta subunit family domain-containing protein n=1 Tax=Arthrobacter sp. cf158 TaxID=1761744 RepID=UPI00089776DE|nr:N,N-dimethylformamidase beta subunit family domain-containing protein [Arthrobacter sp. cf158]SDW90259.1 N,N-dimethylformamidase [Arthrobacter sp. cf158]
MSHALRSYTNTLSYRAGDAVSLYCDGEAQDVRVSLKRLVHSSDATTDLAVAWDAEGTYQVRKQRTCLGSFATAPIGTLTGAELTVGLFFWLASGRLEGTRTLWSITSPEGGTASAQLNGQMLSVTVGEKTTDLDVTVRPYVWYFLGVVVEDGVASIELISTDLLRGDSASSTFASGAPFHSSAALTATLAGRNPQGIAMDSGLVRGHAVDLFTGKIGGFFVSSAALDSSTLQDIASGAIGASDAGGPDVIARWDFSPFSAGDDPNVIIDRASGSLVPLVNLPTQGVTGRFFDGSETDYRHNPSHYAAVHFHSSDMSDAGWDPLLTAKLPSDLPSGVYAIEIAGPTSTDLMPLFVTPAVGDITGRKVAVVLPTFCYLAYGNEGMYASGDPSTWTNSGLVKVSAEDAARVGDSTYGLSLYDFHPDGSAVAYSSTRRPIVNMRRGYKMWLFEAGRGFSADMYLVEWLESRGIEYDILTDYEVHAGGASALKPYSAVISGMHPEYTTAEQLDAFQTYRDSGGGLMYLGGNGWYWVTGVYSSAGLTVEIRRGHAGPLVWMASYPGEVTLMSGKQPGGLWRHRGRAPQKIFGVGMAAQGWSKSYPYYRSTAAASDPSAAWILEGVEEDPIGDYGALMGGAAGDEIDRADLFLGTPYHATLVASSRGHDNYYQRVPEETGATQPSPNSPGGEDDPEVHSDIIYFRTPGGGEVFSAGSMAWSGALNHNGGDNGVSRMTENVLRRFLANRS